MTLAERIKTIKDKSCLNQKEFAATIGVTEGYVSKLLKGGLVTLSESLALLLESKYGYNKNWILTGEGEPQETSKKNTFVMNRALRELGKLKDCEVTSVLAFISGFDQAKKILEEGGKNED